MKTDGDLGEIFGHELWSVTAGDVVIAGVNHKLPDPGILLRPSFRLIQQEREIRACHALIQGVKERKIRREGMPPILHRAASHEEHGFGGLRVLRQGESG